MGVVESVAVKTTRLAKYAMANAVIVMAMYQSAMHCDKARAVVMAHQMSDPEGSAFNLFKSLEARFTQKATQPLQKKCWIKFFVVRFWRNNLPNLVPIQ